MSVPRPTSAPAHGAPPLVAPTSVAVPAAAAVTPAASEPRPPDPREAERRYARLAEANVVGMMFWEIGGTIVDANDRLLEMLGFDRADLAAGRIDWRTLTPGEYAARDAEKVGELLAHGMHGPYEKEYCHRDGHRVPVLVASAFHEGSRERGLSIVIDQTAARAAERERDRLLDAERTARHRIEKLQRLGAELTRVLVRERVASVLLRHVAEALGAHATALVELAPDGGGTLVATHGVSEQVRRRWARLPAGAPLPLADVATTRRAVFVPSRAAWSARWRWAASLLPAGASDGAWAALPLLVEERLLGALVVVLPGPRPFDDDERAILQAFADLGAQALERARLYEAERAARAEAERERADLSAVLELVPVGIGIARDPACRDMRANAALAAQLGTPRGANPSKSGDAAATLPFTVWQDGRELAPHELPMQRAALEGRPVTNEVHEIRRADGRVVQLLEYATPLFDEAGRVRGAVGAFVDVSEREQLLAAERQARAQAEAARAEAEEARRAADAANRAKSEFLAVMSHELRTPLNAIGGYAELMALGVRGPTTPEQQEDLVRIQRSQRHLLGLINGVLNYARIEAGAVQYDLAPVPLGEVLDVCDALTRPQLRARGLALTLAPVAPTLRVLADREKLQQVLLNLLGNAIKFTAPGGHVRVRCELLAAEVHDVDAPTAAAGERVAVLVEDTGVGIAPEQLARIFEPFVQVDARLTRTQEGVGLGLAISRDLARGMGGDLMAASTPGVGSVFRLVLPRG